MDRNTLRRCYTWKDGVALRKESVDRNPGFGMEIDGVACRSPQGERG